MSIIRDKKGTPILDLAFNVANGELTDCRAQYKFGKVDGLDATKKTVWTGSTLYTFPESRKDVYIASTNSTDVCTGGIIKAVMVKYLNSSWDLKTAVHCLNGRTPVLVSSDFMRCNRVKFLSNCSTHINTGQLWLGTSGFTAGVPTDKYGHIPSGEQQSFQGFFSVPRGHTMHVHDLMISVNEGKQSHVEMYSCSHDEDFTTYSGFSGTSLKNTYQAKNHYDIFQATMAQSKKIPMIFPHMTDVEMRAVGEAGGDVEISVEWSFFLVGSSYFVNDDR